MQRWRNARSWVEYIIARQLNRKINRRNFELGYGNSIRVRGHRVMIG